MTSTTDTAGHPEVAEISDLAEGLLPPSRSADVRRHVDGCPPCADVHASLEEIRSLLGALPSAPPMPADVADRIDAALAAEALLSTTAPDSGAEETLSPVGMSRTKAAAPSGAHVSRETSAPGRPAGHSRAATGPGRAERRSRSRRRTAVLGAVLTFATLGLGTVLVQSMGAEDAGGPVAARSEDASVNTFSGDSIENQVTKLLAKDRSISSFGTEPKPVTPGAPTDGPNTLITVNVPDCIRKGIGRSESPLGAQQGDYQGTQAYLVVLDDTSHADRVTAYVVDAACIGRKEAPAGEVLTERSYARPAAVPSTGS